MVLSRSFDNNKNDLLLPICSWSDVQVHEYIGEGTFALVMNATYQTQSYALKCLKQGQFSFLECEIAMEKLREEARILASLNHPNIVRIRAVCNHIDTSNFFFLMDRLEDYTLETKVGLWKKKTKKQLKRSSSFEVLRRLGSGLRRNNSKNFGSSNQLFPRSEANNNVAPSSSSSGLRKNKSGIFGSGNQLFSLSKASKATTTSPPSSSPSSPSTVVKGVPSLYDRLSNIGLQVSQALAYLHDRQIMHCDIKPSNVGFDRNGNVRLFDFGLSEDLSERQNHECGAESSPSSSSSSAQEAERSESILAGSFRYMAPELMQGKSNQFASDIYSLTLLLWSLVTFEKPYGDVHSVSGLIDLVLNGGEDGGRPSLDDVPSKRLCKVFQNGWATNPSDRSDCEEVVMGLMEVLAELQSQDDLVPTKRRSWLLATHGGTIPKDGSKKKIKAVTSNSDLTDRSTGETLRALDDDNEHLDGDEYGFFLP